MVVQAEAVRQRPHLPNIKYRHRNSIWSGGGQPVYAHSARLNLSWPSLHRSLKCNGRFSCLFSHNNRKQDEARKALESALGEKKTEFEKWDREIKRRQQAGGGGDSGGGGWFKWFLWFNDDHFWQEAQQTGLAILGIIVMYLIIAKGDVMIAVVINPLLFLLRGTRNGLAFLTALVREKLNLAGNANFGTIPQKEISPPISARENVVKKWGSG